MIKKLLSCLIVLSILAAFALPSYASDPDSQIASGDISKNGLTEEQTKLIWKYLDSARFGEEASLAESIKPEFNFELRSMVLMEASTGTVLYEFQKDERLMPASVTKIMTLLLILEAVDNNIIGLEDMVTASEHAVSMGGTQIYLEVGEQMSVDELIKCVAVPSANDAAVALAEYVAGSEEEFVRRMNEKAAALGMNNTNFTNVTGLFDDEAHLTTANDIAIMSRELLKHQKIFDYTKIWMDSVRNGSFGLANTNKMLRTYSGMNGLKTGYTQKSLYCFSGTAERDGMTLIVTIMGAKTSNDRFAAAAKALDYGFASFALAKSKLEEVPEIKVVKGKKFTVKAEVTGSLSVVVPKGQEKLVESEVTLADEIEAPAEKGSQIGLITYKIGENVLQTCPIVLSESVEKAGFGDYFGRILNGLLGNA